MESILDTVKTAVGANLEETAFDTDIIMHTNTVFMTLTQIGIGPTTGFFITDKTKTWSNFLGDSKDLEGVKTYIALKVRLLFDPPERTAVLEALTRSVAELEFRLLVLASEKPVVTTPVA